MSTAAADRSYVRRERLLGAVLILLIALTAAHFVHDSWLRLGGVPLRQQHAPALAALPKAAKLYAPVAYRIAIPTVVAFLMHIFPRVGVPSLFAGMDVVCLTGALWMIYLLSSARIPTSEAGRASRGATVALTLMFCTAALFWLPQYQRPKTTPTALFLAFSVLSVQRQHRWMLIVQLLCTALQAFCGQMCLYALGSVC